MADVIEKSKKRKKHGNSNSKPSKRVAIDGDNERLVKLSYHEADKWAPVIAYSPGVILPTSIPLKPYTKPRTNAPPRSTDAITTTELLLHSSEHPKIDYTGREEEVGGTDALLKHYVGVYDPATGKLEVMEARKMVVRGSVRAHQADIEEEPEVNLKELRNNLGQAFGTKKAKKAIASIKENAIIPDKSSRTLPNGERVQSATTAAVLATMKDVASTMLSREELQQAAGEDAPRPKANTAAEDVKDVYTVDSLIGSDILKQVAVLQWQEATEQKMAVEVKSRFVANRIVREVKNIEKLRILRYMLLLLEIQRASKPSREGLQIPRRDELKALANDIPASVIESIKRKFTVAGVMNRFKQDLLITHLCALACLVDNFMLDMFDLQEDLRLDMRRMSHYFREIGARVLPLSDVELRKAKLSKAEAAQRRSVKLKLPLEFPKASVGRKK